MKLLSKLKNSRFFYPILVSGIFVVVYILYYFFNFSYGYITTKDYHLFLALAIGVVGVVAIYLWYNKKLTWKKAIVLLLICGIIMRVFYGLYTGATVRQHDVGNSSSTNTHYGIIKYIYENKRLPDLLKDAAGNYDFNKSYQMYHPKFHHILCALFMSFNNLILNTNVDGLFAANRILMIIVGVITLFTIYEIFKQFNLSEKSLAIATAIICFSPIFYILSGSLNNDGLSYMFTFLAILFTLKWFKKPTYGSIVIIAFSIGLGMASKLSVALVAVPIAAIFLYRFIKVKDFKKYIPMFIVFAIIVFPIGLYFPIMHLVKYDMPINYVWVVTNQALKVKDTNFFSRFINPFSRDFISNIFVTGTGEFQNNNIYAFLMKTFIFGEWYWAEEVEAALLYIANIALVILFIFSLVKLIIYIVKNYKTFKWDDNKLIFVFINVSLGVLYFISFISFNLKYPFTCTMDFRYVVPIMIPFTMVIVKCLEKVKFKDEKHNKFYFEIVLTIVAAFCYCSYLLYGAAYAVSISLIIILIYFIYDLYKSLSKKFIITSNE